MKGKGKGWHGESDRHAEAARGNSTGRTRGSRGMRGPHAGMRTEWNAKPVPMKLRTKFADLLNDLYASEESEHSEVERDVQEAIEQMEEMVLGPDKREAVTRGEALYRLQWVAGRMHSASLADDVRKRQDEQQTIMRKARNLHSQVDSF